MPVFKSHVLLKLDEFAEHLLLEQRVSSSSSLKLLHLSMQQKHQFHGLL